jgi:hypothetical protein
MSYHLIHSFTIPFSLFTIPFSLLKVVIAHLNDKDDDRAGRRNEVGNEKEDTSTDALLYAQHQPLAHKTETAYSHHAETWQRDTVGLTGANGLNSLRQIA